MNPNTLRRLWLPVVLGACVAVLAAAPREAFARGEEYVAHAGEFYAIRAPGVANGGRISEEKAREIALGHRWIYVNSAEKTVSEAVEEATMLADAFGRPPLVLVYMPRHTTDGQRNEYSPRLMESVRMLVRSAVLAGGGILVCAKGYGVHQALHAIREIDSPSILLIGISPAFGVFGNALSENVRRYIGEVEATRAKYCMIASEGDVFPWEPGGAAFARGIQITGDPRVFQAMDRNRDNVGHVLLQGPGHDMDHYLDHGLAGAMKRCAHHFGMDDGPVGDIVYVRKDAAAAAAAERTGEAWLVPLIFLTAD